MITDELIIEEAVRLVKEGVSVTLPVNGMSMLPFIIGGTSFLQQKLMPPQGDPAQQKMMMIMPLIFMFIFLTLPSGVVLYWVVNNLWAIGQQYVTNRVVGPPTVRTVRPPAERRLKRAGSGKTDAASEKANDK
jgi:YidC/Oxa1 family membrane protein insertase